MKQVIVIFCILHGCVALGTTSLAPAVSMAGVPKPVQEYAESLYPNKKPGGTVLQGAVEVTSELTTSFFPGKRFYAIHAVNRTIQALISQGDYRSLASLENNEVSPADAALVLKEISVTDQPTAERVVQLYSHLYGGPLVTPDAVEFAKKHADARHSVSDLDPKAIVKTEAAQDRLKVTAHFGSRVAIRRVVFLMSKNGVTIIASQEVFRSRYYR